MNPFLRTQPALCLWFFLCLGAFLFQCAAFRLSERLPERLPMVVVLPSELGDTDRQTVESGLAASESFIGATMEFVPKEIGLARVRAALVEAGVSDADTWGAGGGLRPDPDDVPENTIPSVYLIRSRNLSQYRRMAEEVRRVLPGAQIEYADVAHRRLGPVLAGGRILSVLALAVVSLLFFMSAHDRFALCQAGRISASGAPSADVSDIGPTGAVFSVFGCAAVSCGIVSLLGFAAERCGIAGVQAYADLASRFFLEISFDWMNGVMFLAAWVVLGSLAGILGYSYSPSRHRPVMPAAIVIALMSIPVSSVLANPVASLPEARLQEVHDDVTRQIRQKEAEYEREQERLKKTRREAVELGKKERQILKKLESASIALSKTHADLAVLDEQLNALKKDIQITQEEWRAEQFLLERGRARYARRLRAYFLATASGRSFDEIADLAVHGDFWGSRQLRGGTLHLAQTDRAFIRKAVARKADIEQFQRLLSAKEKSLVSVQDQKRVVERRQDRERKHREDLLAEARSRKSALDEMARQMEESNANTMLLLTSLRDRMILLKEQLAYLKKDFEDKKGLLRWPVAIQAVRSVLPYGKFYDETIGSWRVNRGIDILTENNQSVVAVSKGEVVFSDFFGRMGNLVILAHGGDYFTLYAHLSSIAVKLGGQIDAGDKLGLAGNTGLLEDPAVLHFEIRDGSKAVNPESWLGRRN